MSLHVVISAELIWIEVSTPRTTLFATAARTSFAPSSTATYLFLEEKNVLPIAKITYAYGEAFEVITDIRDFTVLVVLPGLPGFAPL